METTEPTAPDKGTSLLQKAVTAAELVTKSVIAIAAGALFVVVLLLPQPWADAVVAHVQSRVKVSIKDGKVNAEFATSQASRRTAELDVVQEAIDSALAEGVRDPTAQKLKAAREWVASQKQQLGEKLDNATHRAQQGARPAANDAEVPPGWLYFGLAIGDRVAVPSENVTQAGGDPPSVPKTGTKVNVRRLIALVPVLDPTRGTLDEIGKPAEEPVYFVKPGGPELDVLEVQQIASIGSGKTVWVRVKPPAAWVTRS